MVRRFIVVVVTVLVLFVAGGCVGGRQLRDLNTF